MGINKDSNFRSRHNISLFSCCTVYYCIICSCYNLIFLQLHEIMTFNWCIWEYILLHYLPISLSHLTAVAGTPPPHSPSLASGCGCNGCSGGLGPDEAEKGSTAVLSLWLPAPSPPPHIMNNGTEKYIYLLIAPAPWLRPFSLAQTAPAQGRCF